MQYRNRMDHLPLGAMLDHVGCRCVAIVPHRARTQETFDRKRIWGTFAFASFACSVCFELIALVFSAVTIILLLGASICRGPRGWPNSKRRVVRTLPPGLSTWAGKWRRRTHAWIPCMGFWQSKCNATQHLKILGWVEFHCLQWLQTVSNVSISILSELKWGFCWLEIAWSWKFLDLALQFSVLNELGVWLPRRGFWNDGELRQVSAGTWGVSREHCMERVWRGWLCVWSLLIFSRNGTCYIWLFFRNIAWRFPPRKFLQHMSVCVREHSGNENERSKHQMSLTQTIISEHEIH